MIRKVLGNRLYLSAVGVALVLVVCVAYLFAAVLDQPLTSRPKQVTVAMQSTGGLFEGSAVTYRGIKIGRVTTIEMAEEGIEATVSLTSSTDIPKDSLVRVRSLSPVGEQYLDFQPQSQEGPFLADGDTIPATSTDLPKSLSSTVVAINDVLEQIDDRKLRTVLRELSVGLDGTGEDIGRMVDQGELLISDLERTWPATDRLLSNGQVVLDIATDNADEIRRLGTSARQLAAFLRDYDPELRRTLRRAPGQLAQLERLIEDADTHLPEFLSVGVSLTDLFAAHDPHLRELLGVYAGGMSTLSDQIRNGRLHIEIIGQKDQRCDYGTPRRAPRNPERRAMRKDGRCSASFTTLQRGAAHAPGPVR